MGSKRGVCLHTPLWPLHPNGGALARPDPHPLVSLAARTRQIAPETSIKLALNDWLKHHIVKDPRDIAPWERVLIGGVSGAVGQVRARSECPGRLLQQWGLAVFCTCVDSAPWHTPCKFACASTCTKHAPIACLLTPTQMGPAHPICAPLHTLAASRTAAPQGLVYPLDTVRTRLAVCHSNEYAGIWQTAVRLARNEGYAAFYRGLVPSMVGGADETAARVPSPGSGQEI